MPELYGNPRKSELRDEIRQLHSEVGELRSENLKLRGKNEWLRAAKIELELKIERMDALAKEVQSIAGLDMGTRVFERIQAERRARHQALADQVMAELAAKGELAGQTHDHDGG